MLLVLSHSRTGATARLRDAVLEGVADAGEQATALDALERLTPDVKTEVEKVTTRRR